MTDFELGQKFATVIISFRPFWHLLSISDQITCLRCVHRHLQTDGVLAFDLFQVDASKMISSQHVEETEYLAEFELPDG
ncbi:MAG: hypothetical protein QGG39_05530 [Candidatus Poribacteria bacterium]|jgi:hypothetical protein|nr:hypothetical protein [Candidatus Poribacteria bacterium]